jgi:hypothetical protein
VVAATTAAAGALGPGEQPSAAPLKSQNAIHSCGLMLPQRSSVSRAAGRSKVPPKVKGIALYFTGVSVLYCPGSMSMPQPVQNTN